MRLLALWICCLSFPLSFLAATSLLLESDQENVERADLICAFKVTTEAPIPRNGVATYKAQLEVIECFKGLTTKNISIEQVVAHQVRGAPQLNNLNAAILFLSREDKATYSLRNWLQGVVPLEWNEKEKSYVIPAKVLRRPKIPKDGSHQSLQGSKLSDYRAFVAQFLVQKK